MGCDNGEGAMRRLGSGTFDTGTEVVPAAARVGIDS